MNLTIDVAGRDSLTANQRLHWAEKARRTKAIRTKAAWAAFRQGTQYTRAHVLVTVTFQDARRRDVYNWHLTVKAIIDGLVDAGVIPDDSDKYLTGPDMRPGTPHRQHGLIRFHLEVTPR